MDASLPTPPLVRCVAMPPKHSKTAKTSTPTAVDSAVAAPPAIVLPVLLGPASVDYAPVPPVSLGAEFTAIVPGTDLRVPSGAESASVVAGGQPTLIRSDTEATPVTLIPDLHPVISPVASVNNAAIAAVADAVAQAGTTVDGLSTMGTSSSSADKILAER